MTQDGQKNLEKSSLIGRILSMEAFLLLMGIASLVFGILDDKTMNIFFGILIIPGVFLLHKVRKKDWAKHWQEMEAEHQARLEFDARRKAAKEEALKKADSDEK